MAGLALLNGALFLDKPYSSVAVCGVRSMATDTSPRIGVSLLPAREKAVEMRVERAFLGCICVTAQAIRVTDGNCKWCRLHRIAGEPFDRVTSAK